MLSKIICEGFEKKGKRNLRDVLDKITNELSKYSLSAEHSSEGMLNKNETWKYKIPSINAEVKIRHSEEYEQIDQETSNISNADLIVDFSYLENTDKKDIKYIRNIFLKNGMKKIKDFY